MNFLKVYHIICLLLVSCSITLSAQSGSISNVCDTIYTNVEVMPEYKNGATDILKYISTQISPIISDCITQDSSLLITGTYVFKLTIDQTGKVIDAIILRPELTGTCKSLLIEQLLAMTGWKPGRQNGHNVCTYFMIPIRINIKKP